jgi:hypothetical protein
MPIGASYKCVIFEESRSTSCRLRGNSGPTGWKRSIDHLLSPTKYDPRGLTISPWGAARWPVLYCNGGLSTISQPVPSMLPIFHFATALSKIETGVGVAFTVVLRVAARLAGAGIERGHRGRQRGYSLAVPADQTPVRFVADALEGESLFGRCVPLAREEFTRLTIAELARRKSRRASKVSAPRGAGKTAKAQ